MSAGERLISFDGFTFSGRQFHLLRHIGNIVQLHLRDGTEHTFHYSDKDRAYEAYRYLQKLTLEKPKP